MNMPVLCDTRQLKLLIAGELKPTAEAAVTEHLNRCAHCQREIETLAADDSLWQDAIEALSTDQPPPKDPCGETLTLSFLAPSDDPHSLGRIGHYEIMGVIGRGGTGVVLKAFDSTLHRNVAIKVLSPHLAASGPARTRFARESVAVAAVVHEHIVPIYAVDEFQGVPYLVMRYVPGESLAERISKHGPLDTLAILRVGLQTALGLAAAHAQGIVHRDVKPANILMEHGVERLLLTDFGLARTVDDASLTCSGILAGTPQYMAPEQARGEGVDGRSDLFSLGCVLYAAATGHSPFRAETTMGVLHRICHDKPRPVRQINTSVPPDVARLIDSLLEKNSKNRPASAEEVAAKCQKLLVQWQSPEGLPMTTRWQRSPLRRVLGLVALSMFAVLLLSPIVLVDEEIRVHVRNLIFGEPAVPKFSVATSSLPWAPPPPPTVNPWAGPPYGPMGMSTGATPAGGSSMSPDGAPDVDSDFTSVSLPGEALFEMNVEQERWDDDIGSLNTMLDEFEQ
jgi:serine/threonine protein kinase